jgi:hypothetical protein
MILPHILFERIHLLRCLLSLEFGLLPPNMNLLIFVHLLKLKLKKSIFTLALNAPYEHIDRAIISSCFIRTFNLRHARIQAYSLGSVCDCGYVLVFQLWNSICIFWILHLRYVTVVSFDGVDCALAFDQSWFC